MWKVISPQAPFSPNFSSPSETHRPVGDFILPFGKKIFIIGCFRYNGLSHFTFYIRKAKKSSILYKKIKQQFLFYENFTNKMIKKWLIPLPESPFCSFFVHKKIRRCASADRLLCCGRTVPTAAFVRMPFYCSSLSVTAMPSSQS